MSYIGASNSATEGLAIESPSTNFESYLSQIIYITDELENSIVMLRRKNVQLFGEVPPSPSNESGINPRSPAMVARTYEGLSTLQLRVEELRKEIKVILEI